MGTDLLEREAQLDALDRWWVDALAGAGRLVVVGGEAGLGKTALVRRFCATRPGTVRILAGACEALATPIPLGPVLDMASDLPAGIEELLLAGGDAVRVRRSFLDEIGNHAGGTLAVIEDAHWADEATLDLIRHVGRRLGGRRAMLLFTYRDDEVGIGHPLRVLLGDLATLPEMRRIQLRPLSVNAVARLAEGSGVDGLRLHQMTSGNPFFVTEALAAGGDALPASVRDAVLARASRLSSAGREALEAAACLGARVAPTLLERVSAQDSGAVDECLGAGMLVVDEGDVAFRHELARTAVAAAVPLRRAAAYHAKALALLGAVPADQVDPARLADHAERAGDGAALFRYARAAAERAAGLASHREAAALYRRSVMAAGDQPAEARAALHDAVARERYLSHDLAGSIEAADEALALWRRLGNGPMVAGNLLGRVNAYMAVGEWITRIGPTLDAAIDALNGLPASPQLAMAWAMRAAFAVMGFRNADALGWAERARAAAEELGDAEGAGDARLWAGLARVQSGDETGWRLVEERRRAVLAGPVDYHRAKSAWWPYHVAVLQHQYARAERFYGEGIAYAMEHDVEPLRQFFLASRARQLLDQGRWDDAEALATENLDGPVVEDGRKVFAIEVLARVRARRGENVGELIEEARRVEAPARHVVEWMDRLAGALGEAAWLSGHGEEATDALNDAYVRAVGLGEPWSLGEVAFWLWRVGALAEPPSGMAQPYALSVAGDWAAAHDAWVALGCPYEAARALASADQEDALRHALEEFDRFGARPDRDLVARRLRRLGVHDIPQPRRNMSSAESLTHREAEVLSLVSAGMRNAEIAAKLFLSERTVEHHVAALLRKLGVHRRADAARRARELGVGSQ